MRNELEDDTDANVSPGVLMLFFCAVIGVLFLSFSAGYEDKSYLLGAAFVVIVGTVLTNRSLWNRWAFWIFIIIVSALHGYIILSLKDYIDEITEIALGGGGMIDFVLVFGGVYAMRVYYLRERP